MQNEKAYELVTTGSDGINRLSPRNGFNGFLRALLGDRALLPPSLAKLVRKLDASVGASGPHDFAVRVRTFRPPRAFASTASRAHVRDDRETPLCGMGRHGCRFDLGESGKDLFL
jgi:hypothetical protein